MKRLIKCIIALIFSFIFVNAICMFYYHVPYWIDRDGNATSAIWRPGAYVLQAKEGFGYSTIDDNGYVNEQKPLANDYVLVMGSSHTQGKEVFLGNRYSDILNDMCGGENQLVYYNLGADGHYFLDELRGFNAAIQEFPDSSAVILEMQDNYYTGDRYRDAIDGSRIFDVAQTGKILSDNMDDIARFKAFIKENLPLVSLAKKVSGDFQVNLDGAFGINKNADEEPARISEERYDVYSEVSAYLKSSYDGDIIIMYHPTVEISEKGDLVLNYPDDYDSMIRAFEDSGIIFIDTGSEFEKMYVEQHVLPYGFDNTEIGKGHLNKYGHLAVANAIYNTLYGDN